MTTKGKDVTLEPGKSASVSFVITPNEAGIYQVAINGLAGSFISAILWQLIPCVYCSATFTTEEELISHMETNHPNMPYLISGYPVLSEVIPPAIATFHLKLFVPGWTPSCEGYPFDYFYFRGKIYSSLDYSKERFITHDGFYPWRTPGFHEAELVLPTDYEYQGYHLLPYGIYNLQVYSGYCGTSGIYTRCGETCHAWELVDTGITIAIV